MKKKRDKMRNNLLKIHFFFFSSLDTYESDSKLIMPRV